MRTEDLLIKGYFPKELPPCFFTGLLGTNFSAITSDILTNQNRELQRFESQANNIPNLNQTQQQEERLKLRQRFKNRMNYSECANYSIPKPGLARNIIKIPNPLHQGKLSDVIAANYSDINAIFEKSSFSTTKPQIQSQIGEGKRAVTHDDYGQFKERCIIDSFKFLMQLKTDISKFYPSIYTHIVPWVTFGGKEQYKRNRSLHTSDSTRINSIYGDNIDNCLMWCQNQQTKGIPIGPDTSFIVAEIVACHIDTLLEKRLKTKMINHLIYRYYDDYSMYFSSELNAQIALTELKSILSDFELEVNDSKTKILLSRSELESEWALELKSFYFRPFASDQKEDLWNYFSKAFKLYHSYPNESVLRLAINKFNFVRIEKDNWNYFESLIYRVGLTDPGTLQKIAKLLVSYRALVNKNTLKSFCLEIIDRHYKKRHDYELTWALWLLRTFNIQPPKKTFEDIFFSKSNCASIIALDLLNDNNRIKNFDYSLVSDVITTDNLNSKDWLLAYEATYHNWIASIPTSIIDDHFYFAILRSKDVHFYDKTKKLEPLTIDRSNLEKIERKINQITEYVSKHKSLKKEIKDEIEGLFEDLRTTSFKQLTDRKKVQEKLSQADDKIKALINKVAEIQEGLDKFEKRKPFFVIERRLEELEELTEDEIEKETRQDKELLFDPKYDE